MQAQTWTHVVSSFTKTKYRPTQRPLGSLCRAISILYSWIYERDRCLHPNIPYYVVNVKIELLL